MIVLIGAVMKQFYTPDWSTRASKECVVRIKVIRMFHFGCKQDRRAVLASNQPELISMHGRQAQHLCEVFRERLPIVFVPPVEETFPIAVGEASVVENEFSFGAAVRELELHNRVYARFPVRRPPGLHNSLVGHQLDMPAY